MLWPDNGILLLVLLPRERRLMDGLLPSLQETQQTRLVGKQRSRHYSLVCVYSPEGSWQCWVRISPECQAAVSKVKKSDMHRNTHSYPWLHCNHQADISSLKAYTHTHTPKTWAFTTGSHTHTHSQNDAVSRYSMSFTVGVLFSPYPAWLQGFFTWV